MPDSTKPADERPGAGWWLDTDGVWYPPKPQPRIVDRSITPDPDWATAGWQRY